MSPTRRPLILAACYGGGHIAMIVPVIRELHNTGIDVVLFALTTAWKEATKHGIPFKSFIDLDISRQKAVSKYGSVLAQHHGSPLIVPHEESVAYLGTCFYDLVQRHGYSEAASLFREKQRHALLPILAAEEMIIKHRPMGVLVTNSPKTESALVIVARKNGIPSWGIEDLYGFRMFDNTYADVMFTPCRTASQNIQLAGFSNVRTVETGNPAFDSVGMDAEMGIETRKQLGISHGAKVMLYACQPQIGEHIRDELAASVLTSFAKSSNGDINRCIAAVRMHPSQDSRDFEKLSDRLPVRVIDTTHLSLNAALSISDVLLTSNSTVAVQATLHGIQCILLGKPGLEHQLPLHRDGLAHYLESESEIERVLNEMVFTDDYRLDLANKSRVFWNCDGKASCRIATAIATSLST